MSKTISLNGRDTPARQDDTAASMSCTGFQPPPLAESAANILGRDRSNWYYLKYCLGERMRRGRQWKANLIYVTHLIQIPDSPLPHGTRQSGPAEQDRGVRCEVKAVRSAVGLGWAKYCTHCCRSKQRLILWERGWWRGCRQICPWHQKTCLISHETYQGSRWDLLQEGLVRC